MKKWSNKRILIVDDSKVVHALINQFITSRYPEIECVSVYNGEEALSFLQKGEEFVLVFLDIMMPVMDGIEFLKQVKERGINLSFPVVVCSEADESLIQKALSMGAVDRLKKPFKNTDLYEIIEKYVMT
jgi:CheY-like chemotaxis protein